MRWRSTREVTKPPPIGISPQSWASSGGSGAEMTSNDTSCCWLRSLSSPALKTSTLNFSLSTSVMANLMRALALGMR